MARLPSLNRTLSSTIPFARGVADRAVRTAAPVVSGVVGRVAARLPRRSRPAETTPATFTPTLVEDVAAEEITHPAPTSRRTPGPTPATVARNVSGPRPSAKSPAKRKPRSVPGAKLPVTRPST